MKKESVKRIVNQFRNIDIADIALAQNAYANKDIKTLREIFNKPNLKDSSVLGLGNLANQYIKNISKPSSTFIKQTKSITKIEITKDYYQNLDLLNNRQKQPDDSDDYTDDSYDSNDYIDNRTANDIIMQQNAKDRTDKQKNFEISIDKPNIRNAIRYVNDITNNNQLIKREKGFEEYRVMLLLKTDGKESIWVSSKWESLKNRDLILDLINSVNSYISQEDNLYQRIDSLSQKIVYKILAIEKLVVKYR